MSVEPDDIGPRERADGPVLPHEPVEPALPALPVVPVAPVVPAVPAVPAVPVQSSEDTDVGWGDYTEPDDDWLLRDRPPHWDR
jgi:hypothetical protein